MEKNVYKCSKCDKLVKRDSTKKWILSWCDAKGRYTRIMLQNKIITNGEATKAVNI